MSDQRQFTTERGFTLVELLVALVIIGLSIIALTRLHAVTAQHMRQSLWYTQAMIYAQSIADTLRASGDSDHADIRAWKSAIKGQQSRLVTESLPDADVNLLAGNPATVTISWQVADTTTQQAQRQQVVIQFACQTYDGNACR